MSTETTGGGWTAGLVETVSVDGEPVTFQPIVNATGDEIAWVRDATCTNLIAAAPAMAAALARFVSTIDATGGIADPEDGDGIAADPEWLDLRDAYDVARALLATVRG